MTMLSRASPAREIFCYVQVCLLCTTVGASLRAFYSNVPSCLDKECFVQRPLIETIPRRTRKIRVTPTPTDVMRHRHTW